MRLVYDRFAKESLSGVLSEMSGLVLAEREIATDPQGLDLWCEPNRRRLARLAPFGILRRIVTEGPCAFEFFHQAPSLEEVLASLRKALVLRTPAMLPPRPKEPWLWIIAGGCPTRVLPALGLGPAPGWPAGIYETLPGFRLRLVVARDLPRTLDTLILRVLGAGATLRRAARELHELGPAHPMARIVIPILVKLHLEEREKPAQDRDPLDQEFLMETQDLYEAWHQRVRAEGRNEGRAEGRNEGRNEGRAEGRNEGRKEGRKEGCVEGETRALLLVLTTRGLTVSSEQEARIRACRDIDQLERWLKRASTATSTDEVLR
jgi:hypothetical protein